MKHICKIICLIFPFIGFSQTEKEVKSMFTDSYHKVDSTIQEIILENTWKYVYYYDYDKKTENNLKKINSSSVLKFENGFFYDNVFSGKYFFNKNFLYLYGYTYGYSIECPSYKIISLIDNEYLVVEEYLPQWKERYLIKVDFAPRKKANNYKSTHRRFLLQMQKAQ